MPEALQAAIRLARKEKATRRGRRGYSDDLKKALRTAAKSHSKSELVKKTGISFPTIQRIVGRTRKAVGRKRRRAVPQKKSKRRTAAASTGRRSATRRGRGVTVQISVDLPSGGKLQYTDLKSLRADAQALSAAAKELS